MFVQLASPDYQNTPAKLRKLFLHALITAHVAVELFLPERSVVGWCGSVAATFVPVPEATVHENNSTVPRKDQVRFSGQFSLQSVTQASAVQVFSYDQLRLGVLAPDAGHHSASGGSIDNIGHWLVCENVAVFMRVKWVLQVWLPKRSNTSL